MSVKSKEEAYEKIRNINKSNNYTTGNTLDYQYFSKRYKLIAIDLSKQVELENPNLKQQINFIGKLGADEACSLLRNQKKQLFNFYKILWVSYKIETQKIINLLNDLSNEETKFATKRWYVIESQTTKGKYKQGDTNLKQKSLNQVFMIVLMHLFQLQEISQ